MKKIGRQISMPSFLAEIITQCTRAQVRSSCNILAVSSVFRNPLLQTTKTGLREKNSGEISGECSTKGKENGDWGITFFHSSPLFC